MANCPIRNSDQLDKYMGAGQGGIALFLCNSFEKSGICKDKCSTIRKKLNNKNQPTTQSPTILAKTTEAQTADRYIAQRAPHLQQSKSCNSNKNCMDCQDHIYKKNKEVYGHPNPLFSKKDLKNNICSGSKSSDSYIGCKKFCNDSIYQY